MKRFTAILVALILLLACAAAAETDEAVEDIWLSGGEIVGGWELTDLTTAKGGDALKALFLEAASDRDGVTYTPAALLATQVVAGTNYCILCHSETQTDDGVVPGWCLVYLYHSPDGEAKITNVVDIDIADLSDYGIFH